VGSGEHTSTSLSRDEARDAMDLMLQDLASDAQL
jgi:anthranilate phosphoribosyltransferase